MDYQFLKVSCGENGVVTMTISSPATLNALNSTILGEIDTFIHTLDPNQVRVLVITGEGKSFVAGADISEMAHLSEKEGLAFGHRGSQVFKRIEDLPFPVIAAVNGFALGGGCELAMACDIRIASAKARFGQPEVGLGIIPGFSGTYRLPKLVGQGIAKELIYTGKMIGADEALRIGLVNQVVAPEELAGAVDALVNAILKNARSPWVSPRRASTRTTISTWMSRLRLKTAILPNVLRQTIRKRAWMPSCTSVLPSSRMNNDHH